MSFKEDFSQLLKIQLRSRFTVEVDSIDPIVTVVILEDSSFSEVFPIIRNYSAICYRRLIYRIQPDGTYPPLTVKVKARTQSRIIKLPGEERTWESGCDGTANDMNGLG